MSSEYSLSKAVYLHVEHKEVPLSILRGQGTGRHSRELVRFFSELDDLGCSSAPNQNFNLCQSDSAMVPTKPMKSNNITFQWKVHLPRGNPHYCTRERMGWHWIQVMRYAVLLVTIFRKQHYYWMFVLAGLRALMVYHQKHRTKCVSWRKYFMYWCIYMIYIYMYITREYYHPMACFACCVHQKTWKNPLYHCILVYCILYATP